MLRWRGRALPRRLSHWRVLDRRFQPRWALPTRFSPTSGSALRRHLARPPSLGPAGVMGGLVWLRPNESGTRDGCHTSLVIAPWTSMSTEGFWWKADAFYSPRVFLSLTQNALAAGRLPHCVSNGTEGLTKSVTFENRSAGSNVGCLLGFRPLDVRGPPICPNYPGALQSPGGGAHNADQWAALARAAGLSFDRLCVRSRSVWNAT